MLHIIFSYINLAMPVIVLYLLVPVFILNPFGQIACALALGVYIWFCNKKQHDAFTKPLVYEPTGVHKSVFEELIRACQVNPEIIALRYAYTAGQIALTSGNTIVIDPVCFSLCDDDPEAKKVKDIFEQHIQGTLTSVVSTRIAEIRHALTPGAERFIFKHELGHVVARYSPKKLLAVFFQGTLAAYAGIVTGVYVAGSNGYAGIFVGVVVGYIVDVLAAWASNLVFKLRAEKNADRFAARYSSREDIEDAAVFFAKHQEILDTHALPGGLLANVPSVITSGHPNGKARAAYLLKLVESK